MQSEIRLPGHSARRRVTETGNIMESDKRPNGIEELVSQSPLLLLRVFLECDVLTNLLMLVRRRRGGRGCEIRGGRKKRQKKPR